MELLTDLGEWKQIALADGKRGFARATEVYFP